MKPFLLSNPTCGEVTFSQLLRYKKYRKDQSQKSMKLTSIMSIPIDQNKK